MTDRPWPRAEVDISSDEALDEWAAQTESTEAPKWVLVHVVCGHLLGYSNHKQMMQATRNRLVIAGRRDFVVEERDATNGELARLVENERCESCTLDRRTRKAVLR